MWAPPGSPGSRAAGPGPGQHEAGAGFGSSSRGAAVTQDGHSGASAGEPEKRGRDPRRLHRPPSPLPLPLPAAAGPGGRGRTGGTAGAEACGDGRGRGRRGGAAALELGRRDPVPVPGHPPPGGVPGRARVLSASPVSLFSGRCEGTVAAAHLGCIRRRLRREMRRALLTGPRWGEIYALLSGTEPHKSSPRTPRGCSAGVPVPPCQHHRPSVAAGAWGCAPGWAVWDIWDIWEAAGPAVLWLRVARGLWVTEASQASPGCCGDIRAWPCPPELLVPHRAGQAVSPWPAMPVGLEVPGRVTRGSAVPRGLATGVPCPAGERPAWLCAGEPPERSWKGSVAP